MDTTKDFIDFKTSQTRVGFRWRAFWRRYGNEIELFAVYTIAVFIALSIILAVYMMWFYSQKAELDYLISQKVAQTIKAIQ